MTTKPTLLITAGPTLEPIDPVRYLSNHSSGKMGLALASAALKKGFQVVLIHGPIHLKIPTKVQSIPVTTAIEMRREVLKRAPKAQIIIMAAAVADYRVKQLARHKIKKTESSLTLHLVRNPDILKELGKIKKKGQILVGFAAETRNLKKEALRKLKEKNCDFLIANNVARKDIGFGASDNEVLIFSRHETHFIPKNSKTKIAQKILSYL